MRDNWHESARRLFDYARSATGDSREPIVTTRQLIARLGVTSATFTNWKARGVSKLGAINAAIVFGCSVEWVLTGASPASASAPAPDAAADPPPLFRDLTAFEAQYITLFRQLPNDAQLDEIARIARRLEPGGQSTIDTNTTRRGADRRAAQRRRGPGQQGRRAS